MATVPLTTFIEFTVAQGTARVVLARASEGDYDPRRDFYKGLRERTIRQLVDGWSASAFRRSLREVRNPRKQASYEACRRGLTQWARGREILASRARAGFWEAGGLEVRVNPELRLTVDGGRFLVKLYFKADELTPARRENTLFLLSEISPQGVNGAILDARRGQLITENEQDPALDALLVSDAAAFSALLGTP
jgi:hypothetical protein